MKRIKRRRIKRIRRKKTKKERREENKEGKQEREEKKKDGIETSKPERSGEEERVIVEVYESTVKYIERRLNTRMNYLV